MFLQFFQILFRIFIDRLPSNFFQFLTPLPKKNKNKKKVETIL